LIIESTWDKFAALLPTYVDTHPLGCHRPRIPGRLVSDTLVQVLVFGCASHRIADASVSATTLRRRPAPRLSPGSSTAPSSIACIPGSSTPGQASPASRSTVSTPRGSVIVMVRRPGPMSLGPHRRDMSSRT
jgi:hypothetical protein